MAKKVKYWNPTKILSYNCYYNLIFGERSNGKTYGVLKLGLEEYMRDGSQVAIIRRWDEDFKGKRGAQMYSNLIKSGEISRVTNGKWTTVYSYSGRWYLAKVDPKNEEKLIIDKKPCAFGFALTAQEHDKSTGYPDVKTVFFDEFITRESYLPNEFVMFMNVLSTIIRDRDDVKIFMCGNTVNKYCPYFNEMGLTNVKYQKKDTIDVYQYGESKLRVAVEYSDGITKEGKKSDFYFAFNNPKLKMITQGEWEIAIYPHCPIKYLPKDVKFRYYIEFDKELLECEIVVMQDRTFTFIHRKTTPIKYPDTDLVFSQGFDSRPNYRRKLNKPHDDLGKKLISYFQKEKVYYQDNEVGEIVRNYLLWCTSDKIK